MYKKNVLLGISLLGSILLLATKYTDFVILVRDMLGRDYLEVFINILISFPFILFFVLLTHVLPSRVFRAWWQYAKIAIPSIALILIFISLGFLHSPTAGSLGWGVIFNQIVDLFFIVLTLFLFSLGSLIQIYRAYTERYGRLWKLFGFLVLLGILIPVVTVLVLNS